jgi:hypothetical protein
MIPLESASITALAAVGWNPNEFQPPGDVRPQTLSNYF